MTTLDLSSGGYSPWWVSWLFPNYKANVLQSRALGGALPESELWEHEGKGIEGPSKRHASLSQWEHCWDFNLQY